MKTMKITVYNDPGHAWGKVKKSTANDFAVIPSTYSYQRGDFYYLEEDCDLTKFIKRVRSAGHEVSFNEKQTNKRSKIRSYERAQ